MPAKPSVIVHYAYRRERTRQKAAIPSRIAMPGRYLACVAGAILLAGCMADAANHDQSMVPGYRYHDANHTNGPSGNASPQAIYNATHGTWLWPPAENDKPNG